MEEVPVSNRSPMAHVYKSGFMVPALARIRFNSWYYQNYKKDMEEGLYSAEKEKEEEDYFFSSGGGGTRGKRLLSQEEMSAWKIQELEKRIEELEAGHAQTIEHFKAFCYVMNAKFTKLRDEVETQRPEAVALPDNDGDNEL